MTVGWKEIERFQTLITDLGLPSKDFALFGMKCPYCGKSDRINRLEAPEELRDCPPDYRMFWEQFKERGDPVFCTFCRQVMSLDKESNKILPLEDG